MSTTTTAGAPAAPATSGDGAAPEQGGAAPSVDMRNLCPPQPVLDALGRLVTPGLFGIAVAMLAAAVLGAPMWTKVALAAALASWAVLGFAWAVWPRPPYRFFPRTPRQRVPVED